MKKSEIETIFLLSGMIFIMFCAVGSILLPLVYDTYEITQGQLDWVNFNYPQLSELKNEIESMILYKLLFISFFMSVIIVSGAIALLSLIRLQITKNIAFG